MTAGLAMRARLAAALRRHLRGHLLRPALMHAVGTACLAGALAGNG